METIAYTVGGTTTEVSLTSLGAGVPFRLELGTHGESKCILPLPTLPPETAVAIPFEAQCVIWTGRAVSGTTYSGGTILFAGRRTDNSGQAGPSAASQEIVIEDAWYDLKHLTFQCAWQNITSYSGSTPSYGTPYTWPDCVLFQVNPAGQFQINGTFAAYAPPAVFGHIHTGQQIKEILAYAIYIAGVNLQIGQIDPATYVPYYPVRSMRCSDALKVCLRPHPNCTCEIDYTTIPPTFNIRQQSNLTSVTLPYKSTSGAQTHLTSQVRPLPELVPTRVGIYLKEESTVNGQTVISVGADIYPNGTVSGLRSLDTSLDLTGPKLAKTSAALTTAAFDPTSLTWWAEKVPTLRSVSDGGQVPASGTGALALLSTVINGGTTAYPKGIQVTDNSGNAIDLTTYGYELLTGTPASWMENSAGATVVVIEANVTGFFSYYKSTTAGSTTAALVDQIGEHMHTVRVKLINTASATFTLSQTLATGETYPGGLAESIYNSLSTLQYQFTHVILEAPFATLVKPGKHCLNLTGGAVAWGTMNAMVQSVEIEFYSTNNTLTVAKTTVHCGPVPHLEAGELVQIFNLFCNRDLSKINPNERTGSSMSGGAVTLGSDSPKENSTPAPPVPAVHNLVGTDATSGNLIQITSDGTQGSLAVQQLNPTTGASIAKGYISPCYSGTGSPSATSLPANAYYRLFDRYIDSTTKNEWICTGAGNNNVAGSGGSTWSQIGGVGGSGAVTFFVITTLVNGNYFYAAPLTIANVAGLLTVTPGAVTVVAKHNRMWNAGSETFDGTTITYSSYTGDNYRLATDPSSNTEFQVAFPRYITLAALGFVLEPLTGAEAQNLLNSQCVIKCIPVVGSGISYGDIAGDGVLTTWQEIEPRVWARAFNQTAIGD
ncbi:hypothetical protein [Silvimonas sp.]|uniref:hypothetical protein n=1 Tax=Silvimonas sp. TaxID=2650811 RepID=UPI00283D1534|nr:hypothetical protein [Silvimonas sp.]MDR3427860.1 hypothetical protein [Silvimonas sp.]